MGFPYLLHLDYLVIFNDHKQEMKFERSYYVIFNDMLVSIHNIHVSQLRAPHGFMAQIREILHVASYPGREGGEKTAWYRLLAHARPIP